VDSTPAGSVRCGWLAALGELGDAGDFDRVCAHLGHPRARIRLAALSAASMLGGARVAPAALRAVSDSSRHVRRVALRALIASEASSVWRAHADELLHSDSEGAQRCALELQLAAGGWDAVPALVFALGSRFASVREHAWRGIDAWQRLNGARGWIRPSAEARQRLTTLWTCGGSRVEAPRWVSASWNGLRSKIDECIAQPPA
jgi:hypothetical protein